VGDEEHRASATEPVDRLADQSGALRIDVGRRLVEDHERGVSEKGPRDCDSLQLPGRELAAAVPDEGVVSVGKLVDERVGAGKPCSGVYPLVAGRRSAEADVLGDGAPEERGPLRYPGDLRSPGGNIARGQVDGSDHHPPLRRFGEAQEKGGDGALASAARSHERDGLAGRELEVNCMEHRALPARVGERDAFQTHRRHPGARRRRTARAGHLADVDELEEPVGDGEAVRARVELGGEVSQWEIELGRKDQHRQPGFEADVSVDQAHAYGHGDERDSERRGELQDCAGEERDA
jgi:hypothetical protein